jgi:hypothetical protein
MTTTDWWIVCGVALALAAAGWLRWARKRVDADLDRLGRVSRSWLDQDRARGKR